MNLNDKQKKLLRKIYRWEFDLRLNGNEYYPFGDARTGKALVHRGLAVQGGNNNRGFRLTQKGYDLSRELFGLIMSDDWERVSKKSRHVYLILDIDRFRQLRNRLIEQENGVTHDLGFRNKIFKRMEKYEESVKMGFWDRRN